MDQEYRNSRTSVSHHNQHHHHHQMRMTVPPPSSTQPSPPVLPHAESDQSTSELRSLDCNLTSLCDHIQSQGFGSGAFSDVVVKAMGSSYHLHRLILSRSSYFRYMIHLNFRFTRLQPPGFHFEFWNRSYVEWLNCWILEWFNLFIIKMVFICSTSGDRFAFDIQVLITKYAILL